MAFSFSVVFRVDTNPIMGGIGVQSFCDSQQMQLTILPYKVDVLYNIVMEFEVTSRGILCHTAAVTAD